MPYMRSGNIFSHLMLCDKLQQSITGDSGSHFGSGLLKKVITFVKDMLLLIILQSDKNMFHIDSCTSSVMRMFSYIIPSIIYFSS